MLRKIAASVCKNQSLHQLQRQFGAVDFLPADDYALRRQRKSRLIRMPKSLEAGESEMIKNLLEPDENPSGEIKSESEKAAYDAEFEKKSDLQFYETSETENLYEIPGMTIEAPSGSETLDLADVKWSTETEIEESQSENNNEMLFQTTAEPESIADTARKSGLAYGAAITLFGSVVIMLILGWFADLLFGTEPWGIVGGIVLGAVIGFFQFFRITSQIFKK